MVYRVSHVPKCALSSLILSLDFFEKLGMESTKIYVWTRTIDKQNSECISNPLILGRDPQRTIRSIPGFFPQLHLGGGTGSIAFIYMLFFFEIKKQAERI